MNKAFKKMAAVSFAVLLFFCNCLTAFAEVTLPEGTTAGLPEKLTVLDSDGNSVNGSGEYFFYVDGMTPYETYTKNIQIMNLREDKAYHIYFYALPVSKYGDIDLENNCTAVFNLDGSEIFKGTVTGKSSDGALNISDEPVDLGLYEPGDSRKLTCSVTWDGTSADSFIDYGSKLVDTEGTHVLRSPSGNGYIYGEVTFRWVFYAAVDETYVPPKTGVLSTENILYIIALAVAAVMIVIMLILISKKKRQRRTKTA